MIVNVPVSIGELIDKLTILAIKHQHAKTPESQANIKQEVELLMEQAQALQLPDEITELGKQLHTVNSELWIIEDRKRQHEREQRFDDEFIELARSVYIKNDLRASIKRQINTICNSIIIEEKIY
jgi:hypothetical protein